MSKAPKRPAGVHPKAWWDEGDQEWVFGPLVDGKKHGDFTFWRGDGTRCNECHLVMDVPTGPFRRFHENGDVSQEGAFDDAGKLHGTRRWFSTDSETTENTRPQGVSEHVWKSEMDYVHGRVVAIRHFNREGERVLPSNGEPYPERPEGVDPEAEFVEPRDEWHRGDADGDSQHKTGRWRVWNREGQLLEDVVWADDERHGAGVSHVHGSSPFSDARIVSERGTWERGQRVGTWELCDARGEVVARAVYGGAPARARLDAFTNSTSLDFAGLCARHERDGRTVEALLCAARVLAKTRDPAPFQALLARVARPLREEMALTLAMELDAPLPALGRALVDGAHPGVVLNKIAVGLDQTAQSRAALDFTNAALLLSPERTDFLSTRALILMSLGLRAQAELDANELAAESPDQAEFLLSYLRGLFPEWRFVPASEPPETTFDEVPEAPERTLDDVRALVQKYATRLQGLRARMLERITERNPALPPDLSLLLPDGPVPLEAGETTLEDDDGDVQSVEFDEQLSDDDHELPALLVTARGDWTALCWLCWAAGLDAVGLPDALHPPAEFGKAAGMAQQRLWRARDQRVFNGRNARAHQVPSFEWEGTDLAELSPNVARLAETQYAEMQAVFYWLIDPRLKTPWQDNLRGS